MDYRLPQDRVARQLVSWAKGIGYEIEFWDRWARTSGGEWPDDFARRLDPDTPFPEHLIALLLDPSPKPIKVLDVGAGPLTVLGRKWRGMDVDLAATDPLAPLYDQILVKYGVRPPTRSEQAFAEELSAVFPENEFDIVHCRNALDHSIDPLRGIEEMLIVCKEGGSVGLFHFLNEGESGKYAGFHQWNFDVDGDDFVIWNSNERINVSKHVADYATVRCKATDTWIETYFTKKAGSSTDVASRHRARVRQLQPALLSALFEMATQPRP